MKPTNEQHQGTCPSQDTERSPNKTIEHLPDEVLLEIFDFYRQDIDYRWRETHLWLDLAHVCRNWRAITYASPSRLHLGITVGPIKPVHIKTILASHQALPILLDFKYMLRDMTASAIWRMNYALKHRDRVHNIVFEGTGAGFDKFFKATNCAFPVLEGVTLYFNYGYRANIPDTFLRGPDLSDLHLRRLRLDGVSLAFISGFLSSATSLTDLFLRIDTVSSEMSLLFCLRGMTCLRRLDLTITSSLLESSSQSSSSTPKVVLFSRLAYFRYVGPSRYLDALVAKLSAPSLQDVDLNFYDGIWPSEHLPRFINEIRECYHAVHVIFEQAGFHLSMLTQSEYISHFKSHSVILGSRDKFPESLTRLSSALSTKLTTVEELHVFFSPEITPAPEDYTLWRRFYQHFPNVKALRKEGTNSTYYMACTLSRDHGECVDCGILPALEEIDLGKESLTRKGQHKSRLASLREFASARQQAGHPVKVSFVPQ